MLPAFLIGGLISILNYWRIEIGSNQEIYMALAKWWANPSWIPGSFYFSDPPGTRIGFVALLYPFWNSFSFEQVSIATTFVNLFLLGGVWFLILKQVTKLNILLVVLIHLTLFSGLGSQGFYSGEWMFGEAEPKTFAYLFCLVGLYCHLRKQEVLTFLLIAVAAHFHVVIAGWFLAIMLMENLYSNSLKSTLKGTIVFGLGFLPLFIYLLGQYFQGGVKTFEGADSIFINSLTNHLRPWLVKGKEARFYWGLLFACISAGIAFWRLKRCDQRITIFYRLSLYSFLIPTFLLLFAPWEWFNPFLKLFPFRLTLLQKYFLIIPLVIELSEYLQPKRFGKYLTAASIVILVVSGALRLNKNIFQKFNQLNKARDISAFISQKYAPGINVFYLDANTKKFDDELDSLARLSRINPFFVNKFLPFSPGKMIEWQRRLILTELIQNDPTAISLLKNEPVEVVISKNPLTNPSLQFVSTIGAYNIYDYLR